MKRALLLDPFSGTSGDMFLAALVDLGAPFDAVRDTVLGMPALANVSAEAKKVTRGVIEATRVEVICPPERTHRSLSTIVEMIEAADLKKSVKIGAIDTFGRLAKAEAKVHGCGVEEVRFHEVGALDAIFDIVGAHVAIDLLGAPDGYTTAVVLGSGSTASEHGDIPIPAPATLELLAGHRVKFTELREELVTPTGAAIIASRFKPLPDGATVVPERIGYGAGARERNGLPNVLRAMIGGLESGAGDVCIITSTIDDMNPEVYGFLMDRLFARGALEVYYNSILMKKNRPGVEVTVITEEKDVYDVANYLLSDTTTLGVRINREARLELPRWKDTVETSYGAIQVKVARTPGGEEKMSPEYESCREAAERAGARLLDVYDAARREWEAKKTRDKSKSS